MATSSCPKCGGHSFEMKNAVLTNSTCKLMFVQCAHCGTVIGVVDYYDSGELIRHLASKLNVDLR